MSVISITSSYQLSDCSPSSLGEEDLRSRPPSPPRPPVSDNDTGWQSDDVSSLRREIYRYRFNYLFCQSCASFGKSVRRRLPSDFSVYVFLLLLFLEQVALSVAGSVIVEQATEHLRGLDEGKAVKSVLITSVGTNLLVKLLFPVMGWLADVWVGRYRMIHLSMWLLFCGYGMATFLFSLKEVVDGKWNTYALLLSYIVISIGSAGFQANGIPFGADQINYRTTHELSSYFYMYYWVRNASIFTVSFLVKCEEDFDGYIRGISYTAVAAVIISVTLVLNTFLKHLFLIRDEKSNPMKTVAMVLYSSATTRRPLYRSAFSYNPSSFLPSRIDLTKDTHGGRFKEATVEDVKTFLRLLLILVTVGIVKCTHSGLTSIADDQVQYVERDYSFPFNGSCHFTESFVWVFNVPFVLTLVPLINLVLLPFLQEYAPTMLKRIGTGSFLMALCPLLLLIITSVGNANMRKSALFTEHFNTTETTPCMFSGVAGVLPISIWAFLPSFFLTAIAEILVNVTCIEFFYAQSPHTMRGMMVGLYFFTNGATTALIEIITCLFTEYGNKFPWACDLWYYLIVQCMAVLGFITFVVVAKRYKNRQRGEIKQEKFYREAAL